MVEDAREDKLSPGMAVAASACGDSEALMWCSRRWRWKGRQAQLGWVTEEYKELRAVRRGFLKPVVSGKNEDRSQGILEGDQEVKHAGKQSGTGGPTASYL